MLLTALLTLDTGYVAEGDDVAELLNAPDVAAVGAPLARRPVPSSVVAAVLPQPSPTPSELAVLDSSLSSSQLGALQEALAARSASSALLDGAAAGRSLSIPGKSLPSVAQEQRVAVKTAGGLRSSRWA